MPLVEPRPALIHPGPPLIEPSLEVPGLVREGPAAAPAPPDPDSANDREGTDVDGGRPRPGIRRALDLRTADQAHPGGVHLDSAGNPGPDPADQRHLGQRDVRGGQLGLAEVEPGCSAMPRRCPGSTPSTQP